MTQIRNMTDNAVEQTRNNLSDNSIKLRLCSSWTQVLGDELEKPYIQRLLSFLQQQIQQGKVIYPSPDLYLHALNCVNFKRVKVVILGQDPYHGPGQSHGLCFSVLPGVKTPPSLLNIYKELQRDLGITIPNHGYLQSWAEQGVLLLNATLSVEQAKAGSHQQRGWEQLTDRVIEVLSEHRKGLVFLLWGNYAQKKGTMIDQNKHLVLKAPHPSPLSAYRGFLGCGHFTLANHYLQKQARAAIDWSLTDV